MLSLGIVRGNARCLDNKRERRGGGPAKREMVRRPHSRRQAGVRRLPPPRAHWGCAARGGEARGRTARRRFEKTREEGTSRAAHCSAGHRRVPAAVRGGGAAHAGVVAPSAGRQAVTSAVTSAQVHARRAQPSTQRVANAGDGVDAPLTCAPCVCFFGCYGPINRASRNTMAARCWGWPGRTASR